MRVLKTMCCAAAMVACLAPGARADEWNKKTYLTFSGPVQIPGATLPAGTYMFQLAAPDTSRHVVMVSSKEGDKVYGMFITIPNERLDTPNDNLVMFKETPAGAPQAVQAWWYPGDRSGEEFVYPKSQALMIAKANHRDVLATESYSTTGSESDRLNSMKGSKVGRVNETGSINEPAATNTAQSVSKRQTPAATTTAPPATTTARTTTAEKAKGSTVGTTAEPAPANTLTVSKSAKTTRAAGTSGRKSLPRTAGDLGLFELLSALSIGGGLSIRALRAKLARR